ncbi:MAG: sialidase family protein [Eubacteriales bacterium]|nr:sialidase family protein [Eubacteriales bacterium]
MNYPALPGLTMDGQVYYNAEMGTVEAIIPPGPWRTCHGPGMVELPNGDLLCCWFAGTFEGDADIHIVCARLPKGADKWEEPVNVSGDPTRSEQNPSLFLGPDGAVWCMYTAQLGRIPGKDNMQYTAQVRCQKSFDGGKTWGDYETIFPEEGTFSRQPIQILSSGRWIYGNWICTDAVDGLAGDPSAFRISDDQGKTWKMVMMPKSNGRVHATVVELDDGHLVAFMRSREADFIYRSESHDWGDTWSEPKPTVLPNNNSSISAIRTQSGRIAIAYNPTCVSEDMRSKCAWPGLRCPVAVALSEDGGLTFPMIRWMERGEGYIGDENKTNNKQYEYPYLMQSADGRLHLTYAAFTRKAVKYVSFTEEDVMGAKRERYGVYNPTSGEGARDAK